MLARPNRPADYGFNRAVSRLSERLTAIRAASTEAMPKRCAISAIAPLHFDARDDHLAVPRPQLVERLR